MTLELLKQKGRNEEGRKERRKENTEELDNKK